MQTNKLHIGDNLPILRDMEDASVDLVYLDPPFLTGDTWHGLDGSVTEGLSFSDKHFHNDEPPPKCVAAFIALLSNKQADYLTYMTLRLFELHRVLKRTGSIYLHCDWRMSHYLKVCLDFIFGKANFRNEIVWRRHHGQGNASEKSYPTVNDNILFYAKSKDSYFNLPRLPRNDDLDSRYHKIDENGRRYFTLQGSHRGLKGNKRTYYLDEMEGVRVNSLWISHDLIYSPNNRDTHYPTEKPLPLLSRIVEASSQEGDLVLDPFAGSGTALVAAEALNRRWIGIEKNPECQRVLDVKMQLKVGPLFAPEVKDNEAEVQSSLYN